MQYQWKGLGVIISRLFFLGVAVLAPFFPPPFPPFLPPGGERDSVPREHGRENQGRHSQGRAGCHQGEAVHREGHACARVCGKDPSLHTPAEITPQETCA